MKRTHLADVLIVLSASAALAFVLWGLPQLGVYNSALKGRAALMEAESTRQVKVLDAKARQESAKLDAQAEITKAEGSAKAIASLKQELGSSEAYLRWLWIQGLQDHDGDKSGEKVVVYMPTDGMIPLPLSEAGRASK